MLTKLEAPSPNPPEVESGKDVHQAIGILLEFEKTFRRIAFSKSPFLIMKGYWATNLDTSRGIDAASLSMVL